VKFKPGDEKEQGKNEYLLNLITDPDSPVQPQAAALSLRITEGAIIVLDAGLGIRYAIPCSLDRTLALFSLI
jgi:translation elongation factor EF-4